MIEEWFHAGQIDLAAARSFRRCAIVSMRSAIGSNESAQTNGPYHTVCVWVGERHLPRLRVVGKH